MLSFSTQTILKLKEAEVARKWAAYLLSANLNRWSKLPPEDFNPRDYAIKVDETKPDPPVVKGGEPIKDVKQGMTAAGSTLKSIRVGSTNKEASQNYYGQFISFDVTLPKVWLSQYGLLVNKQGWTPLARQFVSVTQEDINYLGELVTQNFQ